MSLLSTLFLISHSLNVLAGLIFLIVSLRLYFFSKIKMILILTMTMISWSITNFILVIPLLWQVNNRTIEIIAAFNIIGSAFVPTMFILFFDQFEGQEDSKKIAVVAATIVGSIVSAIAGLSYDISITSTIVVVDGLTTMRWSPLSSLIIFPSVILAGIWAREELGHSEHHVFKDTHRQQIKIMKYGAYISFFLGSILGIIGVIFVDVFDNVVVGTWLSELLGYIVVSIGLIIISMAYLRSKEIAFLQPQSISSVLVIYDSGIPIMQHDFDKNEGPELSLVSGAITAIAALLSESFDVSTEIEIIKFKDKELLLHFEQVEGAKERVAFILICEKTSAFMRSAVNSFANYFMETYNNQLAEGFGITIPDREKASIQIMRSFGFN